MPWLPPPCGYPSNLTHYSLKADAVLRENRIHSRVVEPYLDDLSQHIAVIAADGQVARPDQLFGLQARPVPVDIAPVHLPAQADSIIPLQTQGTQAWDRYAYVNNNPVMYTDPSGHIGVLALLFHPAVVVVVAVVAVALIVNNILPGRDERIATTANTIESGIAWASNKLKPRYQKPNKREQQQDDIKWNLENPPIGGGSHDNPSPIGEECKKKIL